MIYLFSTGYYDDYTITDILSGPEGFVINDVVKEDFIKYMKCPVQDKVIEYNVPDKSEPSYKRKETITRKYCVFYYNNDYTGETQKTLIEYDHVIEHLHTKFIDWLIKHRGFRKLSYTEIHI